MSAPKLELVVQSPLWGQKKIWAKLFEPALLPVLHAAGIAATKPVHVCLLLSDDKGIAQHNRQWRGKTGPTNVLSFPVPDIVRQSGFLGDIIMSFQTLEREARSQEKTLQQHALHLFVHGFLHLLGHDHVEETKAKAMEGLERKILLELGQPDPYE